jgi:hypothetical protein
VTHLDLARCIAIGDAAIALIVSEFKEMESLKLNMSVISDTALATLATLAKLRHLNLVGCNRITAQGIAQLLDDAPALQKLSIDFCAQISSSSLAALHRYPNVLDGPRQPAPPPAPLPGFNPDVALLAHLAQFGIF